MTPLERFWAKVEVHVDGCWLWTGAVTSGGYGNFWDGKHYAAAHRIAYALVSPIPEQLQLDHLCRVRLCVRPDHLEPVSARVNTLRGVGPAALNAVKTACLRGHALTPENTYVDREGSRSCLLCRVQSNLRLTERRRAARKAS